MILVNKKNIKKHFEEIAKIGALGGKQEDGFLRPAWSDEESSAFEYIRKEAIKSGLSARYDEIGNLYLRTSFGKNEIVMTGSHMDTVFVGGNYDGVAGVIAGLEAIKAIKSQHLSINKGLELVVWRGEESASFGVALKGSKAAFGLLDPKVLKTEFNGQTMEDAIKSQFDPIKLCKFDPIIIKERKPTLTQQNIDNIAAFLELHIEQANKLEKDGSNIGIVTSIRGSIKYKILLKGNFDHSGATPMGKYRRDANLALGYILVGLDKLSKRAINEGYDLAQTIGIINSDDSEPKVKQNAITKVSGFAYFTLDIRSNNSIFMKNYANKIRKEIIEIAKDYDVNSTIIELTQYDPVEKLDEQIASEIEKACEILRYNYQYLPSGAGHDAGIVAKQNYSIGKNLPTGMIFIPCKKGISHSKEEFTTIEAVTKGANVLANVMYHFAK